MRMRGLISAVAALCFVVGASTPAAAATEEERPRYPVVYNIVPGIAQGAVAPGTPPLGANDWECEPSEEHPNPVVLVHGLIANATDNWPTMSPLLANNGYCVFALTYGAVSGLPPYVGGMAPMEESAEELGVFVDKVLAATGAEKVDLVGHSQGTIMPQYYLKFLGGAPKVQRYVAITPVYDGTSLHGSVEFFDRLAAEVPAAGQFADAVCGPCRQFFPGSEFMEKVSEGGSAVPGIEYTTIMTRFDELVTPYTSGFLEGANNIVIQDECPQDYSEHLSLVTDANAAQFVLNALDPANAEPVVCYPVLPALGGGPVHTGPRPVF